MSQTIMPQLELELFKQRQRAPRPSIEVTAPLRRHRRCNHMLERVHYVRRFFPELDDITLRVGMTRVASGMAVPV